jgi:hypothetical protein
MPPWPIWWLSLWPELPAKAAEHAHHRERSEPKAPAGDDPYSAVLYFIGDPQYWHERADQTRKLAGGLRSTEAKTAMLRIAAKYEQLARRAEQQSGGERR